jgi:AAA+ superfamily predicted ATPase
MELITPKDLWKEYVSLDDGMPYIKKYVKDDIVQSFYISNATLYNYDLKNNIVDKCCGNLECYVAHPYNDEIPVNYSEFMTLSGMYKIAFYITEGQISYKGKLQDYDEFLIQTQIPPYNSLLIKDNTGYFHLCSDPGKNGGIIIEGEADIIEQLCRYFYFVINNFKYNGPKVDENDLFRKLLSERKDEIFPRDEFVDNMCCTQLQEGCDVKEDIFPAFGVKEERISALDELNKLIGMSSLKKDVANLISFVNMQRMRQEKGLKAVPVSLHMVFTGNPGTGKTTVARILAKLYKEIGVLSKGQLIEVDRSGLVAGYVGQTAIKTQEKIKEAKGGILFIDEAYTLAKNGNDYGQEAIDTILKEMEDNRNDFIVVVAGYPDLMVDFINSNPGLKSRFNKYFHFEDYNESELEQIFGMMCQKCDYMVTDSAKEKIQEIIRKFIREKDVDFANARDVRNLFETIIANQASRVMMNGSSSLEDMMLIEALDIPNNI